jgi:hypothetical protein
MRSVRSFRPSGRRSRGGGGGPGGAAETGEDNLRRRSGDQAWRSVANADALDVDIAPIVVALDLLDEAIVAVIAGGDDDAVAARETVATRAASEPMMNFFMDVLLGS